MCEVIVARSLSLAKNRQTIKDCGRAASNPKAAGFGVNATCTAEQQWREHQPARS